MFGFWFKVFYNDAFSWPLLGIGLQKILLVAKSVLLLLTPPILRVGFVILPAENEVPGVRKKTNWCFNGPCWLIFSSPQNGILETSWG